MEEREERRVGFLSRGQRVEKRRGRKKGPAVGGREKSLHLFPILVPWHGLFKAHSVSLVILLSYQRKKNESAIRSARGKRGQETASVVSFDALANYQRH